MMNQATRLLSQRIAIAFDFDRTLIPDDSFHLLLKDCQIDVDNFINNQVEPLFANGWDRYLAKAYCLVKESQQRTDHKITKSQLIELGKKLKLYDGVTSMFDRLQQQVKDIDPEGVGIKK